MSAESVIRKQYIVTYKDGASGPRLQSLGTQRTRHFSKLGIGIHQLSNAEAKSLRADPNIIAVEEDGPVTLGVGPQDVASEVNPDEVARHHGFYRMNAHNFPLTAKNNIDELANGLAVAVVDTGIDPHEDLNIVVNYSPFTTTYVDQIGHGTLVAGIIGAKDNGIGTTGIAPGIPIINVKVMDPTHNAWSFILNGLNYVANNANRIGVVNISIGNEGAGAPWAGMLVSVRKLVRAGVVVVAGAGNLNYDMAGPDGVFYNGDDPIPGSLPEVLAVSGMNSTIDPATGKPVDKFWKDSETFGSNYSRINRVNNSTSTTLVFPISKGGAIDLVAPAKDVLTTGPGLDDEGRYRKLYRGTGTSFAAPHVAGLVAQYIHANGRARNEQDVYNIRQALINASESKQPQNLWASVDEGVTNGTAEAVAAQTGDPDSNLEALAVLDLGIIPQVRLIQTVVGDRMEIKLSTSSSDCTLKPCTVPGLYYTIQSSQDLIHWHNEASMVGTGGGLSKDTYFPPGLDQTFYRSISGKQPALD